MARVLEPLAHVGREDALAFLLGVGRRGQVEHQGLAARAALHPLRPVVGPPVFAKEFAATVPTGPYVLLKNPPPCHPFTSSFSTPSKTLPLSALDDFNGKPLPELQTRIKINLRTLFVEVFDHLKGPQIQMLFFKERFLSKNHPERITMDKFSTKLRKIGFAEEVIGLGRDKVFFAKLLDSLDLNTNLNLTKKRASVDK